VTTEKFLVYFLLIACYTAYTQFSDAPVRFDVEQRQAVAGMAGPGGSTSR